MTGKRHKVTFRNAGILEDLCILMHVNLTIIEKLRSINNF